MSEEERVQGSDKYRRTLVPAESQGGPVQENEVRITAQGQVKNYVAYATRLLEKSDQVCIRAMGKAMNKAITVAEITKRRVGNLHQDAQIATMATKEIYEPLVEGLQRQEIMRNVSSISITLSKTPLDANAPGYQAPTPVEKFSGSRGRGGGGRGARRGRGGHGAARGGLVVGEAISSVPEVDLPPPGSNVLPAQPHDSQGSGKDRRGRGGRGRGRGGRGRGVAAVGAETAEAAILQSTDEQTAEGAQKRGGRGRRGGRGGRGRGGRGGRGSRGDGGNGGNADSSQAAQ